MVGETLAALNVRRRFGVTVIGRWPSGATSGVRTLEPLGAEHVMLPGDVLLIAGAEDAVDAFTRSVETKSDPPIPQSTA